MKTYSVLLCLLLIAFACQDSKPDLEKETKALLKLHEDQREFHFSKNAEAFVAQFAPDFISVNRGKITQPSEKENVERFQSYFDYVEFKKWDDVNPPQIRFSDDGKMAYMVVDKTVEITYPGDDGQLIQDSTHFGWVTICRKQANGEWKIECVASTNEPVITTKIP